MANDLLKDLVLGTAQFGLHYGIGNPNGQTPRNEVSRILAFAWTQGIANLDTAFSYGDSEVVLGECMEKEFNIVTKIPSHGNREIFKKSFHESLKHLKKDAVYGLLTHEADAVIKQPKIWEWLQSLKSNGFIKKIGYSLYFPEELEKMLALGYFPDLIQVPLNLLDRRFVPYFKELHRGGCEIHARSAFLQGLFFLDPRRLSGFFDDLKPLLENLRLSFTSNEEWSAFLIRTSLDTGIDKVVIGVNNLAQLQQIAIGLSLPAKKTGIAIQRSNINKKFYLPIYWPKDEKYF